MASTELPLRDLHLPEPVGWWPLAPGWWFLFAITVFALGWIAVRVWQKYKFNAPRRYALQSLASAEADYLSHQSPVRLGKQVSELLRRGMLAYAPRHDVAGLTGDAWLRWLDLGMPVPYFHTDGGRSLLHLPYRDPDADCSDIDVNALLAAAKMRLSTPLVGAS